MDEAHTYGIGVWIAGNWLVQNPLFSGYAATEAYLPSQKIAIAVAVTFDEAAARYVITFTGDDGRSYSAQTEDIVASARSGEPLDVTENTQASERHHSFDCDIPDAVPGNVSNRQQVVRFRCS